MEHLLGIDCLVHLLQYCPDSGLISAWGPTLEYLQQKYALLLLFAIFIFLFTKLAIQWKDRSKQHSKKKKKGDETMRAVCKHWGWKLFTPNIWQVGNNNTICSQNSRAVCNQNVCVFIVYIIELRSWFLWRCRVRMWVLAVACSCAPCSDKLLYICRHALFQEYWHFFRHRFEFLKAWAGCMVVAGENILSNNVHFLIA